MIAAWLLLSWLNARYAPKRYVQYRGCLLRCGRCGAGSEGRVGFLLLLQRCLRTELLLGLLL